MGKDCGLDGLTFTVPSLVRIEFAAECDLRNIIKRFLRTGQLPESRTPSNITDATRLPSDFQELQEGYRRVCQLFDSQPEEVRNAYGNDIDAWLEAQEKTGASGEETKSVGDSAPDSASSGESAGLSGTATA